MGLRLRKSINFGLFRLNASKTGLGWSVGFPGARYTKMANGRTRVTTGIPGTGISWVEESKAAPCETETDLEIDDKLSFWDVVRLIIRITYKAIIVVFVILTIFLAFLSLFNDRG